ncbi:hypothetical protein H7E67_04665 [Clostridium gasigenes]|nr:hypothetical protein [Clostridium gasigenes]MBU3089532.1 hypothetical protein [Clostridium gasigenes]MBU3103763.1 hypothetical protein [Clostridium gasigenes]MBU3132897.1 hypothetical protein [Clostridium gasigenes]
MKTNNSYFYILKSRSLLFIFQFAYF